MGIVRRRKVDVAKDIPARRIADMPVELDGALGTSVRAAERKLARRLVKRYESAVAARKDAEQIVGIDASIVRQVCARELRDSDENSTGENVFSMMRRIGQAKAELAADYTAQLSRNAGKVVFFAKHIDVMDAAEQVFAKRGIGYASIRGDQTTRVRQKNIDAFVNDDDVHVIVCSLTAAGVGINLQVASNVVLAELSWTAAEQTQAIDRVHRIGQDQPVTAWRIIAAQTIDARVAELIGAKESLAARALDGADVEVAGVDVQLEALVSLLTDALTADSVGDACDADRRSAVRWMAQSPSRRSGNSCKPNLQPTPSPSPSPQPRRWHRRRKLCRHPRRDRLTSIATPSRRSPEHRVRRHLWTHASHPQIAGARLPTRARAGDA